MSVFKPSNLLIPEEKYLEKWSVIACDQYTSQPEYWDRAEKYVADNPSSLRLILPEARLNDSCEEKIKSIHSKMSEYHGAGFLKEYPESYVYLERRLTDGSIRRGVEGIIDLECYEYTDRNSALIRATEKTIIERIPARKAVRSGSALDISHVILLADDKDDTILGFLEKNKTQFPKLYDFELMQGGGHIKGWLVEKSFAKALSDIVGIYEEKSKAQCVSKAKKPLFYVVGDGNHSLAAAKACYESSKEECTASEYNPLRYALVELENIHDAANDFKPIHRIINTARPMELLHKLDKECGAEKGYSVEWYSGEESGRIYLDESKGKSAISIIQRFLDANLADTAKELDYIHGKDVLEELSKKQNYLGLLLPAIPKGDFFDSVNTDGVLPRKAFSIGEAEEKRFYLETRSLI